MLLAALSGCERSTRPVATGPENGATEEKRQKLVSAYEVEKDHTDARIDTLIQQVQGMTPKAREEYYQTLLDLEKRQRELEDRIVVFRETYDTETYWQTRSSIDSILAELRRSLEQAETSVKSGEPARLHDTDRNRE